MNAPKGRKLISSLRARGHVISQQLNVAARSAPKGFSITQSKASKTEIIFSYDSSEPPPKTARTPTEHQDLHDPQDLKFFVRPGRNTMQYLKPAHKAVHRTRARLQELKGNPSLLMDFSTSAKMRKGLSPESEDPQLKEKAEEKSLYASAPAELTDEKYHELSDGYLNALVEKLEELQEETEEVDVEYSAGVLTLELPPKGTYVINKQPPNKQIWLSSPITGPKRYDYVMLNEGQDSKEGTGTGEWVYLRDGSTLTSLLQEECGVDMSDLWAPVPHSGE